MAREVAPASRPWVPGLLKPGSPARPKQPALSEAETRLLRALERPGCPVCSASREDHERYFFWFFAESYHQPFTLDALTRSLGFCLGHADVLTRMDVGTSQLTYVYDVLVRRIRELLERPPGGHGRREGVPVLTVSGACPACDSRLTGAARNVAWLAAILDAPERIGNRYGHPGRLCFPHLGDTTLRVSDETFVGLLATHHTAMPAAFERRSTGVAANSLQERAREQLLGDLRPLLSLCITNDADADPYPEPREYRQERTRDPAGEFIASLAEDACAVCREVRRTWLEWTRWLETAAEQNERQLAELLPTCTEHVWPLVRRAGAPFAVAAARQALAAALGDIWSAQNALTPPARPEHERLMSRIRRLWESDRPVERARAVMGRGVRCPVCTCLATARERAVALLLAALRNKPAQTAFQRGYGLCVKHLAGALAADPPPATRALLVEVESARLAVLGWELEEARRKSAWQFRPEQHGAEQTAWRRALLRCAGSLRDRMQ